MTWSFASGEPAGRRPLGLFLAALLVVAAGGCEAEVEVVETQVLVVAGSGACSSAARRGQRADTYLMALFEYPPEAEDTLDRPGCLRCLADGSCTPLTLQCVCGPERPVGTAGLNQALGERRFEALDPEGRYCMVLLAWDDARLELPPEEGERECSCPLTTSGRGLRPRICGVSPWPGGVQENASALVVVAECNPECELFGPP